MKKNMKSVTFVAHPQPTEVTALTSISYGQLIEVIAQ
jgi:hypothetical protein